jgi:hypothetical protein
MGSLTSGTTYYLYLDLDGDGLVDDSDSLLLSWTAAGASETKTVTIPTDTPAGIHAIMLTDSAPPISNVAPLDSALFTVTVARITLTPSEGSPGTSVTVTGSGFTPGRRYQIFFDGMLIVDFTALSDGNMPLCTFSVPEDTAGDKNVLVEEFISGSDIYTATFTVTTSMALSAYSGPAGLSVTVTCRGLPNLANFDIYFDRDADCNVDTITDTRLANNVPHSNGGFAQSVTIPTDATVGSYAIMVIAGDATGDDLDPIKSRTYSVLEKAITLPIIEQGPVGAQFKVSGIGFSVGVAYDVYFDMNFDNLVGPGDVKLADVTAGPDGTFTADVTVPQTASAGTHKVMVVPDGATSPIFATADFLVTVTQITLSPNIGLVGVTVTVTGTGFTPHTTTSPIQVKIYVDMDRDGLFEAGEVMTTTPATIRPAANGGFSCTFTFPDVEAGYDYSVRAIESGNTLAYDDATFTVLSPTITLTPNYGTPGETITITGTNFKVSSTVTLWIDKDMDGTYFEVGEQLTTAPATVPTSGTGAFTCTFTIPPGTLGTYMIAARDGANNFDDAALTVCTPETYALAAAISEVKTEVEGLENTLGVGGDFYMFTHGWFTIISGKLGTFTGTDTVSSLLYDIKTMLASGPPFGDLVTKNWDEFTAYIDSAKEEIVTAVSDAKSSVISVIDSAKSELSAAVSVVSNKLGTFTGTDTVSSLLYDINDKLDAVKPAAQVASNSGSITFTASGSTTIYTGAKVGSVTVSLSTSGISSGESVGIRYYINPSNPALYIQKTVVSGRNTDGWTDPAAAWKVEISYIGKGTVNWAYSVIYQP